MRLRAAVRYSEYKSRKRLPSSIPTDCAVCQDKGLQDRYNCDGYGNDNYKVNIGVMTFFQCPLSMFTEDTWDVIDLISTSLETGTPVVGHCLMNQTRAYFKNKQIILSERNECNEEISKVEEQAANKKPGGGRVPRRKR